MKRGIVLVALAAFLCLISSTISFAFNEAPMLAALVKSGALPPVDQRLPKQPVVLNVPEVGTYGGTWHTVQAGEIDWVWGLNVFEGFGIFNPHGDKIVPELADSWNMNSDYTEMTIHLHQGIKWSDGVPFTVDDVIFWWNEVILGKDKKGSGSPWDYEKAPWTTRGGKAMTIAKIDNFTLKYHFFAPNPTAPLWFQTAPWFPYTVYPMHYVKKFHPQYNANISTWDELQKAITWGGMRNPDQPVLGPWKTASYVPGQRLVLERNPYFWKVDQKGNQLPYIDKVEISYVSDIETLKLRLVEGDSDFQVRDELSSADYPLLLAGQKRGNYTVRFYHTGRGAQPCLFPNLEVANDNLRHFFREQRVRIALSVGIDRKAINDLIYNGLSKPFSGTFGADSWHFKVPGGPELLNEWQQKYSEYDPDRANQLLDAAGYRRGPDGVRRFPDGSQVTFTVLVNTLDQNKRYLDVMQMVKENWFEIGVKANMHSVSNDEWVNYRDSYNFEMLCWESSDLDDIAWPGALFPVVSGRNWPQVTEWYLTHGEKGIPPQTYVNKGEGDVELRLINLYEKVLSMPGAPDSLERHKLIHEAIRIHIDEGPFMIGVEGEPTIPGIVKNNFKNVGDFGITGPHWANFPRNLYPEQFFFASGQ